MNKQYLLLFLLFLLGCARPDAGTNFFLDLPLKESPMLSSKCIDKIKTFPLENSKSLILGGEYTVKENNKFIYVNDYVGTKKLCIFDRFGKHIISIGEHGDGPQELKYFHDFVIHQDTVEIADRSSGRHMRFLQNGEVVGDYSYLLISLAYERDNVGNYWYYCGWANNTLGAQLIKVSPDQLKKETFFPIKSNAIPFDLKPFTKIEQKLFFSMPLKGKLYCIENGSIVNRFSVVFDRKVPNNFHTSDSFTVFDKMNKKGFYVINKYFENNTYLYVNVRYQDEDKAINIHLIYNKRDKKANWFNVNEENPEFNIGSAVTITDDNELVFLVEAYAYNQLKLSTNKLKLNDNPVLLYVKLKE